MRRAVIGVLVLLIGASTVWAGTGEWTHAGGTEGGEIRDIAVSYQNPDKVYAATPRWIYRSMDGGENWSPLDHFIPDCHQVVIDPNDDDYLYARYWDGTLHRSTDGGDTWIEVEIIPGEHRDIHTLTLDGGTPSARALYIGVEWGRIFRSMDSGASWTELTSLPNSGWITDILVDGGTIYVASRGYGVYRSDDEGSTWSLKSNGLGNLQVRGLALDVSTSPSLLLVGSEPGGIYRSDDRGDTWTESLPGTQHVKEIIILPGSPRVVYAHSHGGLFVSNDVGSGDTWEFRNNGLEGWFHTGEGTLALSPSSPNVMYIGGCLGVFRSDNAGEQWTSRYTGMYALRGVWENIAYSPTNPTVAYVALSPRTHPLLATCDGGVSWERFSGYPYDWVNYAITHPTDPSIIYATHPRGVLRSLDAGVTWTEHNQECGAMAIDPQDPDLLYASTHGDDLVYRSTNGGDTWAVKNAGLPGPPGEGDAGRRILQMVIDPQTSTVYSVFERQYSVYRSVDEGDTWTPVNTGVSETWHQNLAIDPSTTPSTLYLAAAGDNDRGLYVSRDAGATWQKIRDGNMYNAAIDPLDSDHLFVARDDKIEESKDGGITWMDFSDGLPPTGDMRISINPHNRYLLTAGTPRGLYHYAIPHIVVSAGGPQVNPGGMARVPIVVSDVTGFEVYSGEFSVFFDPLALTFEGATAGHVLGGALSDVHSPGPGRAELAFASIGALEGEGVLAMLEFSVNPNAPIGYTAPVNLEGRFNEEGVNLLIRGGAVHISPIVVGDATQNGEVSSLDAAWILQHVVGERDLREDFPDEGMLLQVCDVTRNGTLSALDAAWILRFVVGLIPGLPHSGKILADAEMPRTLSVSEGIAEGDRVQVRLGLDDLRDVLAGTVCLAYDGSRIRAVRAEPSEDLSSFLFESGTGDETIQLAFAGAEATDGPGDLAEVLFEVLPGMDRTDMLSAIRVVEVRLNEDGIPVSLAARDDGVVPVEYALHQNFPNPFNPQTTIHYDLAKSVAVRLAIYDVNGQRIRALVEDVREMGAHTVLWDGRDDQGEDVASGVYFCRLHAGGFVDTKKLLFVR